DPVTSPKRRWSRIIYGIGIGALTFLIRTFGVASEGSAYAVILMNCAVPALDRARTQRIHPAHQGAAEARS
ncbi:MAG: RnfABCDGE type electron transport complex subunit D, partial [Spirochaetaceae bacterium]|nr:RnfABCDGE type electron transport complex subunit D [Spirochaetaceae bacterium]